MKVIFSNFDDLKNPYYGGGGAVAVHEVAKRLVGRFNVEVITGKYPNSKNETIDGVEYKRIGIANLPPLAGQLLYQLILPFYALKESFDVWVESFTPPYTTAFIPVFTKKPVIGLTHFIGADEMTKKYKLPFAAIEKWGLGFYKYCIVLTEFISNKVKSKNSKIQTRVIGNGIDPSFLEENSIPENKHILFLGRLDVNQKGLDILLKAYKKIADQTDLPLVIAGTGVRQDEEFLKSQIVKLKLTGRVKLLGRVDGEDKKRLYRESAFYVSPSRYENFPLVVLEVFSFALPIISTDISGFSWVPNVAVDKVPVESVDGLAEAMLHLIKNPDQRRIMGVAAREFAKRFGWDEVAERYQYFISAVVAEDLKKVL